MLHYETVDISTLGLLKRLQCLPVLSDTRLVGGTALALQLGHRKSVDLDFFGSWDLSESLEESLSQCGTTRREGGRIRMQFYNIDGVKVDCVTYDAPWLDPPILEDGLRLAAERDIAAMKLFAIANRGARKDFIDVWFLLGRHDLPTLIQWFSAKYPDSEWPLVLRSLVYFEDAERTPMPEMLLPFDWETAKEDIRSAVRKFATTVSP